MKIAVASDDGFVSAHFGYCAEYVLFTVGLKDEIQEKVILPSPAHKRGFLPGYLAQMGVTHVIAGGMGNLARRLFAERRIITIVGASGPVDRVVEDFLANYLVVGENKCSHDCIQSVRGGVLDRKIPWRVKAREFKAQELCNVIPIGLKKS